MDKVTLKYTGNGYRGRDQVTGQEIVCVDGSEVSVSAEKAAQLLKDYPKNFEKAGDKAVKPEPEKHEEKIKPPEPPKAAEQGQPKPAQAAPGHGIGYSAYKPKEPKPKRAAAKKTGKRK